MALETLTVPSTSSTTHLTLSIVVAWYYIYICLHCLAILCPALPNPDNGMVTWDSLAPGGVATYTCDPGFVLIGEPTRNCGSDGTWSGMAPICERKFITTYMLNITRFHGAMHFIIFTHTFT